MVLSNNISLNKEFLKKDIELPSVELLHYLSVLANDVAIIANNNSSVPDSVPMVNIPLKDWTDDYHVIFPSKFLQKLH